jgi:hypothetical protein
MFKIASILAVATAPFFVLQGCKETDADELLDIQKKYLGEMNRLADKPGHSKQECLDLATKRDADVAKLAPTATTRSPDKVAQCKANDVKMIEATEKCIRTAHDLPGRVISPSGETVPPGSPDLRKNSEKDSEDDVQEGFGEFFRKIGENHLRFDPKF